MDTPQFTARPTILGRRGMVVSGHYLATVAGLRIMSQGGNAIDAAAAMAFCLTVLEPHLNGIGGEVPVLIYSANEKKVYAISGVGWSPAAFTIDWCRENKIDKIPGDGYLPVTTPAVVGTWVEALKRFGVLSLSEILEPAIDLAEEGFPVYEGLQHYLASNAPELPERYPTTAAIYYPGGRVPEEGDLLRNPDLGGVFRDLCRAERDARGMGREAALDSARAAFYEQDIAERIIRFTRSEPIVDGSGRANSCLLSHEDLAEWRAQVELPLTFNYRGLEVHKCSSWTQGPVFLQQLALLQGDDLPSLGHNSAEYLHLLTEVGKLAFADREAYYGDPDFDDLPIDTLLSDQYTRERRRLVAERASEEILPGDVGLGHADYATRSVLEDNRIGLGMVGGGDSGAPWPSPHANDTTHLDAADAEGNLVAATPSGGWIRSSPVIEGLGFSLGTRGQMFYLNPARPNALEPRKRPRSTLTPSLVTRNGRPYLAFGTPGGDLQDQVTLQFFVNHVDFGMGMQQALEAPLVYSAHVPSSFYPRQAHPARLVAEGRLPERVVQELENRGHDMVREGDWSLGRVTAIQMDPERGIILGGASPRRQTAYALGW